MDTYLLHHIVHLITAQPEFLVREEDVEPGRKRGPSLEERLSGLWQALARVADVEHEAVVYCTAQPWEC